MLKGGLWDSGCFPRVEVQHPCRRFIDQFFSGHEFSIGELAGRQRKHAPVAYSKVSGRLGIENGQLAFHRGWSKSTLAAVAVPDCPIRAWVGVADWSWYSWWSG